MIAGSLQLIWSEVSSQQLIIMMPLFAIEMPASAMTIMGILLQVAAFDMIPTDSFYEDMLEKLETISADQDQDVLQQKMGDLGFDSSWMLPNLGSLLFFLGLYPLMLI